MCVDNDGEKVAFSFLVKRSNYEVFYAHIDIAPNKRSQAV